MKHWLIKTEPKAYSFEQLVADGRTSWDGVRNFEARNHLRAMAVGDLCLVYHSNVGKAVVGIARVTRAAYPDPTAPDEDWSSVEVAPLRTLAQPVPLAQLKAAPELAGLTMLRRSRLSVTSVSTVDYQRILHLGRRSLGA